MAYSDRGKNGWPQSPGGGPQQSGAFPTQEQVASPAAMLIKLQEFFKAYDVEGKGFIARSDMQRLHEELHLSLQALEEVFDALDSDQSSFLTPEEFITAFSHFFSESNSDQEDAGEQVAQLQEEKIYQYRGDEDLRPMEQEDLRPVEQDEEAQFQVFMDKLGAQKVLEDDIKQLWLQLKEKPHLLSSFEDFLTRIFSQLQEVHEEKNALEHALKTKIAAFGQEMQHLYEEMEEQVENAREQFLLKDIKAFQARSQELEKKLFAKEQEIEHLNQKQKRLEDQCMALHNNKHETKAENTKLKLTNQELAQELEWTSKELQDTQQQLERLQQEARKLHEEKEMEVYLVTERLQREKSGLRKQLDYLRERNKYLQDEQDISFQKDTAAKANTAASKTSWKQRSGSVLGKYVDGGGILRSQSEEEEDVFSIPRRKGSLGQRTYSLTEEPETGEPGAGDLLRRPLRRIISIEEDPLPELLDDTLVQSVNKSAEEEGPSSQRGEEPIQKAPPLPLTSTPSRGQPIVKQHSYQVGSFPCPPDQLFKIVFVGNSAVGKTSLLRRFCEDHFSPGIAATVGIDYRVKTMNVDDSQVALQLWDTAGQERYRCITQQFFRKVDGVIIVYDLTAKESFLSVRQWLSSIEEAVADRVPVLLLGNKLDNEKEREVPRGLGEQFAKENNLIFYECSACSGHNAKESLLHLARFLKEQEDTVREDTIHLGRPTKKKSCC